MDEADEAAHGDGVNIPSNKAYKDMLAGRRLGRSKSGDVPLGPTHGYPGSMSWSMMMGLRASAFGLERDLGSLE